MIFTSGVQPIALEYDFVSSHVGVQASGENFLKIILKLIFYNNVLRLGSGTILTLKFRKT